MNNNLIWIFITVPSLLCILLTISQLRSDIARTNATLAKIAKQVGVHDPILDNIDVELKNLILEGKKIPAIKRYRIVTGLGLKEAKEYVDALSENLKEDSQI